MATYYIREVTMTLDQIRQIKGIDWGNSKSGIEAKAFIRCAFTGIPGMCPMLGMFPIWTGLAEWMNKVLTEHGLPFQVLKVDGYKSHYTIEPRAM